MKIFNLILLSSIFFTVVACSTSSTSSSISDDVSLLYTQNATGGTLTAIEGSDTVFTLTLTGVSESTLYFSDRPERISGLEMTSDFIVNWSTNNFDTDPPNAVLETTDADGNAVSMVVELSNPSYNDETATLIYTVKELAEYPGFYHNPQNDADLPETFETASLFIDDGFSNTIYQQVVLQVSNALPGQLIGVQLTSNSGSEVSFCTGPNFASSSGIAIDVQSGSLPLSEMEMTSSELSIQTVANSGESGSLAFSITAFLCAEPDVLFFYLRASGDPDVHISGQIGSGEFQDIGLTDTIFSWEP